MTLSLNMLFLALSLSVTRIKYASNECYLTNGVFFSFSAFVERAANVLSNGGSTAADAEKIAEIH